jgi:aflatoxin B1 aldehyde reductase
VLLGTDVVLQGSMTFGNEGTEGARIHTPEGVGEILDVFQKHSHTEVSPSMLPTALDRPSMWQQVDTARIYGLGTSEELLGKINHKGRGLVLETKIFPRIPYPGVELITHEPEVRRLWRFP